MNVLKKAVKYAIGKLCAIFRALEKALVKEKLSSNREI